MSNKTALYIVGAIAVILAILSLIFFRSKSTTSTRQPAPDESSVVTQDLPKESSQVINFYFEPGQLILLPGTPATVTLKASFSSPLADSRLEYLKTEIMLPQGLVQVPEFDVINTQSSGFDTIMRIDSPRIINQTGTITIELQHQIADTAPQAAGDLTVASFNIISSEDLLTPQSVVINVDNSAVRSTNNENLKITAVPLTLSPAQDN